MSHPDNFPLGCVKLDSAQTTRKAWDAGNLGHRVVPVNVDYNITEKIYNNCNVLTDVKFYYEDNAESTKVTFVKNTSDVLNGKWFILSTRDDEPRYKIVYTCAASCMISTSDIKIIDVVIQACDQPEVVALATKLAIEAHATADCAVSIINLSNALTITNVINGLATDYADNCTGFTSEILQQGTKTLVESYTYTYDSNGNLVKCENSSGKNLLNIQSDFDKTFSITGNGNKADVTDNNELRTELAPIQHELLEKIVDELRIMNLHMSIITDNDIKKTDLDTEDNL